MCHHLATRIVACCLTLLCVGFAGTAAAAPRVVASIKPIHSLAAGVMEGVGAPTLLVEGGASEHSYALRPSDARSLAQADVVFLVGDRLETYLAGSLANLAAGARVVALAEVEGMRLLPLRKGGEWETHDHAEANTSQEEDHVPAAPDRSGTVYDAHIWLDPDNARLIAEAMAAVLIEADPGNADAYRTNAARLVRRIQALDHDLAAKLAPIRRMPYIVFHDAYQYFESHYGLAAVGAITVSPDQAPGAGRLHAIRERIMHGRARCVFTEPQFKPAIVEMLREGTPVRVGELDPLGAQLSSGPELYFEVMRALAGSLRSCLDEAD